MQTLKDLGVSLYGAVTGGGTRLIPNLLERGGLSSVVNGFSVPYSTQEFDNFVGGTPEKYCSEEAAKALALASLMRCSFEDKKIPIGIGVSASLAKDNQRKGRANRAFISVCSSVFQESFCYEPQAVFREGQEVELADKIQKTLSLVAFESYRRLHDQSYITIFPGSFNPIHDGHKEIVELVGRHLFQNVFLEQTFSHHYKNPVTALEFAQRDLTGFKLIYTNHPTFLEKEKYLRSFYPNRSINFVCGADTWEKIPLEERNQFNNKTSFIALAREGKDPSYHARLNSLSFQLHIKNQFLSSTQIRNEPVN